MNDLMDQVDRSLKSGRAVTAAAEPWLVVLSALDPLADLPARSPERARAGLESFLNAAHNLPVSPSRPARLHGWKFIPFHKELRRPMNAIASIALATTLIFGGAGATALAAQSSRPDQPLYGVKLVTEDLRLSLAATPEERVSLALDLVHLRVQEARDLVDDRRAVPEYVEERLQRHTQAALEAAAEVDDTRIELILKRIAVRSAAEVRALRVLRTHAPEDRGLILAEQVITDLHTEAEQAKEDPEQFRLNQHSGDPDPRPEATLTPAWWPTAWATAAAPIEATEGSRPGPCPDDAPCAPWHDDAAPTAETDAPVAPTHQPIVPAPAVPTVVDPNPWPVPAIPTAVVPIPTAVVPIPTVVVPIPTVVAPIPTVVAPIPTVVAPIPVPGHDSDNSGPSLPGPWRP